MALILPVRPHTVVFESFDGKLPSDSPLAIYDQLKATHPDWNVFWSVKPGTLAEAQQLHPTVQFVKRFSVRWLFLLPRAQFWVANARMPFWLHKNRGTTYIQTWHGTPLKRLGLDISDVAMPGTDTKKYHKAFITESHRWDYLIAPNQYSEDIFKHAFDFSNHFLETGYPRNDVLVNHRSDDELIASLKQKIVGHATGRVIVYAPTWRDDYYVEVGKYRMNLPFDLDTVVKLLGPEDTFIIRPHYLVADSLTIRDYEGRVKILPDTDINELYLIADLLITDYSSVMFDYAILARPMLFYPYDRAHYQQDIRGFYFDYDLVPGPIVTEAEGFYEQLKRFMRSGGWPEYQEKEAHFRDEFCGWEQGTAAEQVVDLMSKLGEKHD
ncbi:CDP-glycerol glycerophosphotransferase family protein [Lacticaseibacillus mingshuiensis]|uniref:CDP-glycerol glycerophosphotransferase family protein n=1 Tax=Lacticaseibacillus mingshuiensis TaxID=2799574 RepID=A0ABW4CHB1_9LACO|nr:CDP-glycerol glycerophosphotransferase family protein [Lacticaseibacillus mingshuiensis]